MLKELYQELIDAPSKTGQILDSDDDSDDEKNKAASSPPNPKEIFKQRILSAKDFHFGYVTYLIFTCFFTVFCCCKGCCESNSIWCKSSIRSFKKFEIAQKRLLDEQDLQKMIATNRITRFLHKLRFKARQRRAVSFFSKYLLTEKDVDDAQNASEPGLIGTEQALHFPIEKIYQDFEPEEDPWDKRLLYEVTGLRLNENDYRGDDTSSDEDADLLTQDKVARTSKMKIMRKSFDLKKFDHLMQQLIENEELKEQLSGEAEDKISPKKDQHTIN